MPDCGCLPIRTQGEETVESALQTSLHFDCTSMRKTHSGSQLGWCLPCLHVLLYPDDAAITFSLHPLHLLPGISRMICFFLGMWSFSFPQHACGSVPVCVCLWRLKKKWEHHNIWFMSDVENSLSGHRTASVLGRSNKCYFPTSVILGAHHHVHFLMSCFSSAVQILCLGSTFHLVLAGLLPIKGG